MLAILHFLLATVLGGAVCWKLLKERSALLIAGTAPLLGSAVIVFNANWGAPPGVSVAIILALLASLAPLKAERPELDHMSRGQWALLALLCLVVVSFTHYHNVMVLDTDRDLHDLHIVAFSRGIYPPVNPFFPDLAMNGHFGRDLFLSVFHQKGSDPVVVNLWVVPWTQLGAFLTAFASTLVFSGSKARAFLLSSFVFFGVSCGFRVGLIDTFDGSNALAHPWLILLLYLMVRLFYSPTWQTVLVAGIVLGTYQLVYMTSFALLLLTGFLLYLVLCRDRKKWLALVATGVIALGLAVTEGGAFTDLAHRGSKPALEKTIQNAGLRVTVKFPKKALFQVMTSTAEYQRVSVAYHTSVFKGLYTKPRGSGYMYIWDPRFLTTHWLSLYLAPLVLWFARRSAFALGYWLFGLLSYLVPALVDFGPIFEYEYYRWEFTAALGFAGAMGFVLGGMLERNPLSWNKEDRTLRFGEGTAPYLAAWIIVIAGLLPGEKLLNDSFIDFQKSHMSLFPSSEEWRLSHPEFQLSKADLEIAAWLRGRTEPGTQILTDRLHGRPMDMWPDTTLAILSGAFPAGHAFPPRSVETPQGNPAFLPNSMYTAFWSTGDWNVLKGSRVSWVVADTRTLNDSVLAILKKSEYNQIGDVIAAKVPPLPKQTGKPEIEIRKIELEEVDELRLGRRYPLRVELENSGSGGWVTLALRDSESSPLTFWVESGNHEYEWSLVTPLDEGEYTAELSDDSEHKLAELTFKVDFLERLKHVVLEMELPQFKARSLYHLQAKLSGPAIQTSGELECFYRFNNLDRGDYAWEVDSIRRPIDFELPGGGDVDFTIMTPTEPGRYLLEIWFIDRFSGRWIKSEGSLQVAVE